MKYATEAGFTRAVIAFAKLHHWRCAHFRPARTKTGWRTAVAGDGAGFPDLVLIHPAAGRLVVAELKVGRRGATPEQVRWLDAFRAAGAAVYVWRPECWEEIERVLTT